jgi:UDP-N-acetylglucosamine--N-acetylmuramyl-(pentapeptide) pyrophosphoryl-undecaprenol N-acetylglucosamine transferase
MEWTLVPNAGYAIHPIAAAGIKRSLTLKNLKVLFTVSKGLFQSLRLIGDFDADLVVGTGGFVSGPVGLAAVMRGRPLVIQEQNAFPGQTNRLLGRIAKKVYIAFQEAATTFNPAKTVLTGNPVRRVLANADRAEARRLHGIQEDARVVLVFGGSLGSQGVNSAVAACAQALVSDENTHLIWQAGARYIDRMREQIQEHPRIHLTEYIDRMDLAYAAADVAVCRAGAITCSELLLTQTPALLVPSPNVTEDHQTYNAKSVAAAGAAIMIPESELQDSLLARLTELLADDARLESMRASAAVLSKPDAATRIARDLLALLDGEA